MKTRIITGIILAIVLAPILYFGGYVFAIFIAILLGIGIYELLAIKKKAKQNKIPLYIYLIAYLFGFLIIYDLPFINELAFNYKLGILSSYSISYIYLIFYLLILFGSAVFDKNFSIIDASYVASFTLYLFLGLKGTLYLRGIGSDFEGLFILLYLVIVTCASDIFAYFGGMSCYKILGADKVHHLNTRISPKKTIEGTIIGTLFGVGLGFLFAILVLNKKTNLDYPWYLYLIFSLVLSLVGQVGDLILSCIKRYFGIKDFSRLLPGHGGLLDRIDSLLANSMALAILVFMI